MRTEVLRAWGGYTTVAKSKEFRVRLLALSFLVVMLAPMLMTFATAGAGGVSDGGTIVTEGEVANVLRQNNQAVLASSDQVAASSDADSAMATNVNGTMVDAPKDASEGVTFGAESGLKLDVTLPNAEAAGDGRQIAPGVVAYDSGNGSANAVQSDENGGVRMLTIIDNPHAPTAYDYDVTVPGGGSIQLTAEGGAVVYDAAGQAVSAVDTPWAKDATGKSVATWFTTDGTTLTQHVQHNVPGVVYPVSADPFWVPFAVAVATQLVRSCGWGAGWGVFMNVAQNGISWNSVRRGGVAGCIGGVLLSRWPWLVKGKPW